MNHEAKLHRLPAPRKATGWSRARSYDDEGKVIASTDRFLVPFPTQLGADPLIPVTTQITKTIYGSRDRTIATERYTGALVGGLIASQDAGVAPVGFELLSVGILESVSEKLYDAGGRVYRTVFGRVPIASLSDVALAQDQALASYSVYADGVDRYVGDGLSTGIISDTLFDDRGRQYASISHPLPSADLGLTGMNYDGNLIRIRSETVYNSYSQTERSRSGFAYVETLDGTFVGVFDEHSIDNKPHYDAFGNVYRSDLITGGTLTYDGAEGRTTRTGGTVEGYSLTRFDDKNRPVAEMQATPGDVVAVWNDSLESFTNSATGDVIPTKLYRYRRRRPARRR